MLARTFLIIATIAFSSSVCFADDSGRSLPFSTPLTGVRGEPIMDAGPMTADGKPGAPIPVTLEMVAENALIGVIDEDREDPRTGHSGMSAQAKFDHAELAHKLRDNPDVKLRVEDIAMIKDRIGKAYGSEVVWAAFRLIEQDASAPKK